MPKKRKADGAVLRLDKAKHRVLRAIERWKDTAARQVDDIREWRDAVDERKKHRGDPSRYWVAPEGFERDTIFITSWMAEHAPLLDARSVTRVFTYVSKWHREHSAREIPPQPRLYALLQRAIHNLCAVEEILKKVSATANPAERVVLKRPVVVAQAAKVIPMRGDVVLTRLRACNARLNEQVSPITVELEDLLQVFPSRKSALSEWADKEFPE